MSISPEAVAQLRDELQALLPRQRTTLTARDVVNGLAAEIRGARAVGYSLADIAGQLGERGVTISASTLGSYLRAIGDKGAGKPGSRRVAGTRPRP